MDNIFDIEKISDLPKETLAIIKDNNNSVCLGIKSNTIDCCDIEFKVKNILIDNLSVYTLMIKNKDNNLYKCFVPLNSIENKNTLHKLINLDRFNLIIFRDENEEDIFRIENTDKEELNENLVKELNINDYHSSTIPEEHINKLYTNEQLWNL